VKRALRRAYQAHRLSRARYRRYLRVYRRAIAAHRRLRGARRHELGYVIASLEGMARRGRLTAARTRPLFLQLSRNTSFWRRAPYPGSRDLIVFRGSELLFQYFVGRGIQLHPLGNFKKANLLYVACVKHTAPCQPARLRALLDELSRLAVPRGRGWITWEYLLHFGGGTPPWISGMAQGSAVQALARASTLVGRPGYLRTAARALGAFEAPAPTGVRTRGFLGGTHYLQYSFAPRVYIFNAFVWALVGVRDYAHIADSDRGRRLFHAAEPEARREIPYSDTGRWSLYSYRGPRSTPDYHELLREGLQALCIRRVARTYCTYARRFADYQRGR
jgi:hypothetical protein